MSRFSTMTTASFKGWVESRGLSQRAAGEVIGKTRRQVQRYVAGEPIPLTVAFLCQALDLIHDYESVEAVTLTPTDLARICADTTKAC